MKRVAEPKQGLIRLLAVKAGHNCAQLQRGRVKGCFQHETRRRAGDLRTLVVVGNFDGDALLIVSRVAAACRGEHHL